MPEQWPHIRALYERAGFAHTGHTEIVYLARIGDLARRADTQQRNLDLAANSVIRRAQVPHQPARRTHLLRALAGACKSRHMVMPVTDRLCPTNRDQPRTNGRRLFAAGVQTG